jgi:hypothetical protein
VSGTGGNFALERTNEHGEPIGLAIFNFNATTHEGPVHEEIQAALEVQKAPEEGEILFGGNVFVVGEMYGTGNVQVTGGPGDELGSKPYLIDFRGELASRPVAPMTAVSNNGQLGVKLTGGREEAKLTEKTRGRPDAEVIATAINLGDATVNAETAAVNLADKLPAGVEPVSIEAVAGNTSGDERGPVACTLKPLACTFVGTFKKEGKTLPKILPPYDQIEVRIGVIATAGASGENEFTVSGGETPSAFLPRPLTVSAEQTPFGVEDYALTAEEAGGANDTQAGSHPFQLTTTLSLNESLNSTGQPVPAALGKGLNFKLPPGLIGNPTPMPQCTLKQFVTEFKGVDECPPQTAIGVAVVSINEPVFLLGQALTVPVFNLEPAVGEPARFGFIPTNGTPVFIDTSVRTGTDYGVTVSVHNITQTAAFIRSEVTVWGVPGDPRHDNSRGWGCLEASRGETPPKFPCNALEAHNPPPFLAMPTSCPRNPSGEPERLQSTVEADSWAAPGSFGTFPSEQMPAMVGCNRLPFAPSISVSPDGQAASTPTGLTFDAHVPQDLVLNPTGLAESTVRNTTVAMPQGIVLNPAAADGLQACSEAQIGFTGENHASETLEFTNAKASCPDASKVATVDIHTPLLPNDLTGFAYVAAQSANPFGTLIALYVVVEDPVSGTLVKLALKVEPDPVTGQLLATAKNTPQLPFEDFKLHFFGGNRAPLATPAFCGGYATSASIAPWSGNEPAAVSSPPFEINTGPNGSPCQNPLPFGPSLHVSSSNIQAGAFTPLVTSMGREDGNQALQGVQLREPPGLSGLLSGVKLCGEAQANEGTCGPESLIGETTVSVGLGGDPFSVTGGRVYITGPYRGAPFGLSIVNPAKAGPYDLGKGVCDCVVVRASIQVDPTSAALTITTDNTGPYRIPTILGGIPLQIKHVNVTVNRPGFTFNPTNCSPLTVTGTLLSTEGATANLLVPFQVTNCAPLKFTPKITVTTAARASKRNGASLLFKIAYPKGAMGSQSWFNEAKFDLPKQLPARLTTIQKACLAEVFESNRGACPSGSLIGHAIVHTQVLPVPLEGPVYFVSHGGAKFPDAVLVLKGYGIAVNLVGETFINGKTGVTSATFRNTPDVPFESIEVTIPSGPFSEFGANLPEKAHDSFCGQKLVMPTFFKAQNGLEIKQNTTVGVTGCPKAKKKKAHRARRRSRKSSRSRRR